MAVAHSHLRPTRSHSADNPVSSGLPVNMVNCSICEYTTHLFFVVMVVVLKYCNSLLRRCEDGHVSQQAAQLRAATVETQLESHK